MLLSLLLIYKDAFWTNNAPATYQRCIGVILMGLKGYRLFSLFR